MQARFKHAKYGSHFDMNQSGLLKGVVVHLTENNVCTLGAPQGRVKQNK